MYHNISDYHERQSVTPPLLGGIVSGGFVTFSFFVNRYNLFYQNIPPLSYMLYIFIFVWK